MLIIFVDVVRFEAKSVTSKRLIMRRIAFYPVGGERVSLPERHIKAYVDDYCHEFGQTDTDTKLMHLLYVADKGFDILSHIREFLDNHPEIAQDSIKQTLAYFVSHLRYPDGDRYVDDQFAMANFLKETLSLEKVLDLLMMEIRLRFSYTSNPQSIGFSGILLAKRQNSFYCTYFLHNRNVADTKSPYPIKRLEVIRRFNQKDMAFNQSLS